MLLTIAWPLSGTQAVGLRWLPLTDAPAAPLALLIDQGIVAGDADRLQTALADRQRVALVILNSGGGLVGEAMRMAALIRARQLPVIVPGTGLCVSACFLLFAAGVERFAEPGARIGVHSAALPGGGENEATRAVTMLVARDAVALGVPDAIVGQLVATPPNAVAWLNAEEKSAMGIRTQSLPAALGGDGGQDAAAFAAACRKSGGSLGTNQRTGRPACLPP